MDLFRVFVLIIITTFILFAVFSYILNNFYTFEEVVETSEDNTYQTSRSKRLIWLFAFAAIISIMTITSYNALTSVTN